MADEESLASIPKVAAGEPKANSIILGLERRQRKLARLKREAKAAKRKVLQKNKC